MGVVLVAAVDEMTTVEVAVLVASEAAVQEAAEPVETSNDPKSRPNYCKETQRKPVPVIKYSRRRQLSVASNF